MDGYPKEAQNYQQLCVVVHTYDSIIPGFRGKGMIVTLTKVQSHIHNKFQAS